MSTSTLQVCTYCGVAVAWCDCDKQVALSRGTDRADPLARWLDELWISAVIALVTAWNTTISVTSAARMATAQCLWGVMLPVPVVVTPLISPSDDEGGPLFVSVMNITPPIPRHVAPSPSANSEFFALLSTAPESKISDAYPSVELLAHA